VDFVGSSTFGYPAGEPRHTDFDMDHEAHWGWRVDEVLRRLDDWARQYLPDIVLVHLGTNDIIQKKDVQETVENLRQIVLTLRRHNPKVKVFLAQLIPAATTAANEEIKKLNQRLPEMAQSVNTAESPVILVNHAEGFDPWKDTYDGIHPNEAGVDKMAQKWFEALLILPEISGKPAK
jgi:lysophospholipase L1-like esterase